MKSLYICPQISSNEEEKNFKINAELLKEKHNFDDIKQELNLLVERAKEIQSLEKMESITQEKLKKVFDPTEELKNDDKKDNRLSKIFWFVFIGFLVFEMWLCLYGI